jgi:hypothetical protein
MTNLFKSINTDGGAGGGGGDGDGDQNHPASTASELSHSAPTAIVIGTGFGGLAAAIRLSVKGYASADV